MHSKHSHYLVHSSDCIGARRSVHTQRFYSAYGVFHMVRGLVGRAGMDGVRINFDEGVDRLLP